MMSSMACVRQMPLSSYVVSYLFTIDVLRRVKEEVNGMWVFDDTDAVPEVHGRIDRERPLGSRHRVRF